MSLKLKDFMCFLHENKLIDLDNILRNNEVGCINRLKLQKYVYLTKHAWIMIMAMSIYIQ
jgi:uncharacterized protein YwgA